MTKEKLFNVGIKALIENDEGLVLVFRADINHEHKGKVDVYWDLAGGRIKVGQSPEETLRREIKEETGITEIIDIELFTAVISNHTIPQDDGSVAGLALMIYKVKIAEEAKITLSPEHDRYEWVTKKEASKLLENKYPEQFTGLLKK